MTSRPRTGRFIAPDAIFDLGLDAYHVAVLLCLWRHADRSHVAFPSYSRIAFECGTSSRKVVNVIAYLIAKGLLRKESGKARGCSNTYTLIVPPLVHRQGGRRQGRHYVPTEGVHNMLNPSVPSAEILGGTGQPPMQRVPTEGSSVKDAQGRGDDEPLVLTPEQDKIVLHWATAIHRAPAEKRQEVEKQAVSVLRTTLFLPASHVRRLMDEIAKKP